MPTTLRVTHRPESAADLDLLRRLFEESRDDLAALPPALRAELMELQFRAQERSYATGHPGARFDILVSEGVDVGRLVLDDTSPVVQVVDLVVTRSTRGRGIGSAILRELTADADRSGRPLRLLVWAGNHAAQRLYERLGFTTTTRADDYWSMQYAPTLMEGRPT